MGKFQKELSKILDYIEKLKKVNVSEVEPTSHSTKIENVMRADKSLKFKVQSSKLMELAPETKNGYLKVKSIF
ncbi:MAG: Asp-tRNA(Asn)/Glu-tRNA(Gln) amidotransferase GatCAB subunit C [Candidatus Nealsonbacteria bacterium CG23_combo_of_CG06-09_8_20_14_all_39_25]|nr:MAG: Asp-tRNA(Asn)/Glu-tRNA(Gln) amidotransferase GatCAB subunit C [Candidatus Nealsonbacteria bacterium CG23_combo_of_CG06-09_8_20_14_all_39_25]